jgi:hypothetical protein
MYITSRPSSLAVLAAISVVASHITAPLVQRLGPHRRTPCPAPPPPWGRMPYQQPGLCLGCRHLGVCGSLPGKGGYGNHARLSQPQQLDTYPAASATPMCQAAVTSCCSTSWTRRWTTIRQSDSEGRRLPELNTHTWRRVLARLSRPCAQVLAGATHTQAQQKSGGAH